MLLDGSSRLGNMVRTDGQWLGWWRPSPAERHIGAKEASRDHKLSAELSASLGEPDCLDETMEALICCGATVSLYVFISLSSSLIWAYRSLFG